MKIAVAQFMVGRSVTANTETARRHILDAAAGGACMVVLPETVTCSPDALWGEVAGCSQELGGPFVRTVVDASREARIFVVVGIWEKDPADLHIYNTVVAISPDRGVIGSYRKIHLFDALGVDESDRVTAGDGTTLVFEIGGLRFGVMTCYDIRFPELGRYLVDQGANVLVVPAAWQRGVLKEDHWVTLCKARALENTSWLVGAAQVGEDCVGRSLVVDPMGLPVSAMGEESGLLFAELSRERVEAVRGKLPVLRNRRFSVRFTG